MRIFMSMPPLPEEYLYTGEFTIPQKGVLFRNDLGKVQESDGFWQTERPIVINRKDYILKPNPNKVCECGDPTCNLGCKFN